MAFEKAPTVAKHKAHENDTGSTRVQVALLTERINYLNDHHFRSHSKDHLQQATAAMMVGKRKRLLTYLRRTDVYTYRKLIQELGIRY